MNDFSKGRQKVYERFQDSRDNKGLRNFGLYQATVEDASDPTAEGKLIVSIPGLSNTGVAAGEAFEDDQSKKFALFSAYPVLPSAGTNTIRGAEEFGMVSYGIWGPQPRRGDTVLVAFLQNAKQTLVWIGCIPRKLTGFMVPGAPNSRMEDGSILSGLEIVETSSEDDTRPPSLDFSDNLLTSGLFMDGTRGAGDSGKTRESPSMVSGWKTPGDPENGQIGHQLVFDDRLESQGIRLRTSFGNQILISDINRSIYISTAQGNTWVEIGNDGKIDVYGKDTISIHAEGNLNFRAGGNMNIDVGGTLNIKSGQAMNVYVDSFNQTVLNDSKITINGDSHIKSMGNSYYQALGTMSVKSGDMTNILSVGANVNIDGGRTVRVNEGAALGNAISTLSNVSTVLQNASSLVPASIAPVLGSVTDLAPDSLSKVMNAKNSLDSLKSNIESAIAVSGGSAALDNVMTQIQAATGNITSASSLLGNLPASVSEVTNKLNLSQSVISAASDYASGISTNLVDSVNQSVTLGPDGLPLLDAISGTAINSGLDNITGLITNGAGIGTIPGLDAVPGLSSNPTGAITDIINNTASIETSLTGAISLVTGVSDSLAGVSAGLADLVGSEPFDALPSDIKGLITSAVPGLSGIQANISSSLSSLTGVKGQITSALNLPTSISSQLGSLTSSIPTLNVGAVDALSSTGVTVAPLAGPPNDLQIRANQTGAPIPYVSGMRVPQHEPWKVAGRYRRSPIITPGHLQDKLTSSPQGMWDRIRKNTILNDGYNLTDVPPDNLGPPPYPPGDWRQDVAPTTGNPGNRKRTEYIIIHHTADEPQTTKTIRDIYKDHTKGNGWADIGYHYVIERDGTLSIGRPENQIGAHAGMETGINSISVGVSLMGGAKRGTGLKVGEINFTAAQWVTLKQIITELQQRYPHAKILGHRDVRRGKVDMMFDVPPWVAQGMPALSNWPTLVLPCWPEGYST